MVIAQASTKSRFAVLLFTDIVGSADLKARHGVPAYSAALRIHNAHFERLAGECHGIQILQNMGDGYFAEAGGVADAVRFALLFQDAMRTGPWGEVRLTTRVGIHAGEVSSLAAEGGSGIVAPAADLAARVMSLGVGGQILLTRFPFDEARLFLREHPAVPGRKTTPLRWLAHGPYLLKGCDEPVEIFEVGTEGLAPLAPPLDGEKAKRVIRPSEIGLEIQRRPGWLLTKLLGLKFKLLAAIGCAAVGCALAFFPLGDRLVFFGYDLIAVFSPSPPVRECVIVEMDEKSYQDLNQSWGQPWDRRLHARLLDKLAKDRARLTVFDVTFLDPSADEADRKLAEAIRSNGKVVLAAVSGSVIGRGVVGSEVRPPMGSLATNAVGWGIAEVERDTDQTVRRLYSGSENYASLTWTAARVLRADITKQPEERLNERWIGYYGPPQTLPSICYSDALTAPEGFFRDRIVFIGGRPKTRFVGDEVDEFSTPFTRWDGRSSGGLEVVATSVLNLIRGDWLQRLPLFLELILIASIGAALGFGLCAFSPFKALLIGAGAALTVFALAITLLWFGHAWFAWAVVALAQVPLAWLISVISTKSNPVVRENPKRDGEAALGGPSEASESMPMSSATSSETIAAGAMVADHKLLRLIGEGGYGQVWLCRNAVGNNRAMKIVRKTKFPDQGPYLREFRGVQSFMRLDHPRLLRVFHIGPNPPGDLFYYIMQLGDPERPGESVDPEKYEARTLAGDLKRLGRLSVEECVVLALSLIEGLEYLHSQKLIHRDIKPSNVIYVGGVAKLADVGLVADLETTDLSLVGTRDYLDPYFPSTVAADIYGLAKMLYVAMTGLRPGRFPEMPAEKTTPPKQAAVDRMMEILAKACSQNKNDRYASVVALRADLEELGKVIRVRSAT